MQHTCARRPLAFALASLTTLATLSAVTQPHVARACSPPPTFSEMLGSSDVIVIGSLGEISKGKVNYGDESFEVSIATVNVAESIKGPVERGKTMQVSQIDASAFNRMENEEEALEPDSSDESGIPLSMRTGLFLISGQEGDGSEGPSGWSAMRVYDITDQATRDSLVPLVREYTELDAINDKVKRQAAFLEWIVRCAENPTTRREGFYDFSQLDATRQWRLQSEEAADREHPVAKVAFTDGQIDRLVTVWLETLANRDDGAMWFGASLGEYRGELVASRLLDVIATDGEGAMSDVGTWMMTVASIYEWRSGHLLTQKLWESEDPVERAKIVKQFLELAPIRGEIPEAVVTEGSDDEATESTDDVESEAVTEMENIEREAIESIENAGEEEVVEVGAELEIEPMDLVDLRRPDVID